MQACAAAPPGSVAPGAADDADDMPAPGAADPGPVETRTAVVEAAQHGQRLDKVLVALAPEFSRSHLQHLLERGHVTLEPAPAAPPAAARRMRAGECVRLELVPTDESRAFRPEPMALAIVYEDEHLLVLDKPAGLVVHPAAGHWSGTLLNGLLAHDARAAALPRAGIVHRLDKDTSGLMVVARTLPAATALVQAIAARRVQRRYLALVHGVPPQERFSVDAPIGRDPRSRLRMAVVALAAGGRAARTDVQRIAARDGCSALQCALHSGRTHQIRVHLASRGLPLVADALYGGRPALGMQRQALHAWRLAFAHPVDGRALAFGCLPPVDFARAWAQVAGATMPSE
ncbi:MAG: pseudouridine synthase [Pseudomonadota bacterium]